MRSSAILPALVALTIPVRAASSCYKYDGSTPSDGSFVPCNGTAGVSACCASNKSGGDVCLSNGLCLAASGGYAGFIYANGCTDATGEDAACPSICPPRDSSFWGGSKPPDTYNLLQCTPGTWCCRRSDNATSCCNDKRPGAIVQWKQPYENMFLPGLVVANTLPVPASASSNSTSAKASSSSSSPSSSASPSACSTPNSPSAAVVGAAVGVPLGVLLLLAAATMLWMRQTIKNLKGGDASAAPAYTPVFAEKRAGGLDAPMKPYHDHGQVNHITEIGPSERLPEMA